MLKRPIKYKNFDGVDKEGTYYFNLSKSEIVEMALTGESGNMADYFQSLMDNEDQAGIMQELKKLILAAYGLRVDDGDRFEKSEAISEAFLQSAAYDALFMEFLTSAEAMLDFFIAVLPEDMRGEIKTATEKAMTEAEANYRNMPPVPPTPPLPPTT